MIHVDRVQHDGLGEVVEPSESWRAAAAAATAEALSDGPSHVVSELYADDRARMALEQLFADKCAYCETKGVAGFPWEVEHFRPKGEVFESPTHPGYYWLAYTWENLYLSCVMCNQRRKDKPRWSDPVTGESVGKLDQFPLDPEGSRAHAPGDSIADEGRLLLDPCDDDPETHVTFTGTGTAIARSGSDLASSSIKVFALNRKRLRDARLAKVREVLENVELHVQAGTDRAVALDVTLRVLSGSSKVYAGVARAIRRDPVAFGL